MPKCMVVTQTLDLPDQFALRHRAFSFVLTSLLSFALLLSHRSFAYKLYRYIVFRFRMRIPCAPFSCHDFPYSDGLQELKWGIFSLRTWLRRLAGVHNYM